MTVDALFFNRDTRVFIKLSEQDFAWELPVLDGYSFSQATNSTEVSLSEMESASGSRRARQMFNDSFAPAEWSFSTYAQPYTESSKDRSVEEVLWGLLAGKAYWDDSNKKFLTANGGTAYIEQDASNNYRELDFEQSNTSVLGTADIYFVMGTRNNTVESAADLIAYKISGCVVNEATFDYDVEGIATLNWSGFGKLVEEVTITAKDAAPTADVVAGDLWVDTDASNTDAAQDGNLPIKIASTTTFATNPITPVTTKLGDASTYVRNRISYLTLKDKKGTAAAGDDVTYNIVLTGGNVTISNNITFITPETLGHINVPLGHVTGVRSVTGNATCYLSTNSTSTTYNSADLLESLVEDTSTITHNFDISLNIGGTPGSTDQGPCLSFVMPNCHLELPTHSIEDVISVETNFHALPSDIDSADELTVRYAGE